MIGKALPLPLAPKDSLARLTVPMIVRFFGAPVCCKLWYLTLRVSFYHHHLNATSPYCPYWSWQRGLRLEGRKEEGAGEANAVSLASLTDSRRCELGSGGRRRSGPSCARTKAVSFAPSTLFDYRFPPLLTSSLVPFRPSFRTCPVVSLILVHSL